MKFIQIKEKYPKAFGEYVDWNHSDDCPSSKCYEHNDRDLYDFFDEQGFIIDIIWQDRSVWAFYPSIDDTKERKRIEVKSKLIRKDAEEAAFLKAFEMLEKQLNK